MAYSRWRKENINTLQRQQILEAATAFKAYNLTETENHGVDPTIGKKTLKRLINIREKILKRHQVVIHEVTSLEKEITDIDFTESIDELPPQNLNNLEDQLEMPIIVDDDESENDDNTHSDSSNNSEYPPEMAAFTNDIFSKMLGPMMTTVFDIAKPNVKLMTERLKTLLLESKSISEEQRKNYKFILKYYEDLDKLFSGNLSPLDIAERSEKIKEKYGSVDIENFLKRDPNFNDINDKFAEINFDKFDDFAKETDKCVIS